MHKKEIEKNGKMLCAFIHDKDKIGFNGKHNKVQYTSFKVKK